MFIKPLDLTLLPSNTSNYQSKAGNPHFVLQSKIKDSVARSIFSGISGLTNNFISTSTALVSSSSSLSSSTDAQYRKTLSECEFRILLTLTGRKQSFIVAVSDSFDKIHSDWNWVEKELVIKLTEIDSRNKREGRVNNFYSSDQTDALLLKQFEEMTLSNSITDSLMNPSLVTKLEALKSQITHLFSRVSDDVFLNYYNCSYTPSWSLDSNEKSTALNSGTGQTNGREESPKDGPNTPTSNYTQPSKGTLIIARNALYFTGFTSLATSTNDEPLNPNTHITLLYRDVNYLSFHNPSSRYISAFAPEILVIGSKEKKYPFIITPTTARLECGRVLVSLCNAAMNRIIKGAENSLSASAEMFSQHKRNADGDLGNGAVNGRGGGGGLLMGRGGIDGGGFNSNSNPIRKESFGELNLGVSDSNSEEFKDSSKGGGHSEGLVLDSKISEVPGNVNGTDMEGEKKQGDNLNVKQDQIVGYSHIKTALVKSVADLDEQLRNIEFRSVFRLSILETILLEESPCHYYVSATNTFITGNLYFSPNFLCFASVAGNTLNTNTASLTGEPIRMTTSMLFETQADPSFVFVIPYAHIVSVQKQQGAALASTLSISLSGYIAISTINKQTFWISFSATKSRDRISDELLQRIKTVSFKFDGDMVIGGRNGPPPSGTEGSGGGGGSTNGGVERASATSATRTHRTNSVSSLHSSLSIDHVPSLSDLRSIIRADQVGGTGLKFMYPVIGRDGLPHKDPSTLEDIKKWSAYFQVYGKDVCIIKDIKALRDLLTVTAGVPDIYRGDFWMLVSGAWYSKPRSGYYLNLLTSNKSKVNPFEDEIEKDVRRSLPEHPAFQTTGGIDALRRVLTAFSWRNPGIGYAQALNIITAVLLLHLCEEDAFWLLCVIVERMLPDHYTKTLVGSVVDQSVFTQLVSIHLPELSSHLQKLNLDLSTFSVPWFLCLYLNSVSLNVSVLFLDNFFIEGPKFLFWIALSILKINQESLITRGKDDDIFVAILKDFFARLSVNGASQDGSASPVIGGSNDGAGDSTLMTGRPLFNHLMKTACGVIGRQVSSEGIEVLRMRSRLEIVHMMEAANRKTQVRTLCEQVQLSYDEVGCVYDQVRRLEFVKGDEEEDPRGRAAVEGRKAVGVEEGMRVKLASMGGWGLLRRYEPVDGNRGVTGLKTITLHDFVRIFALVSPFNNTPSLPAADIKSKEKTDNQFTLPLGERIYYYCSFQYNFVQRQKAGVSDPNSVGFVVDLAALSHALDAMMKQALHSRLRFIFDLYDLNGDGFLDHTELKAIMDAFLEMFQKSNILTVRTGGEEEEENYLRAVSSFLSAALKMGGTKVPGVSPVNPGPLPEAEPYMLSFNEFLLAVLSQSVFVEYFERTWNLQEIDGVVEQLDSYSTLPDYPLYLSHIFAISPASPNSSNLRVLAGLSLKNTLKSQWMKLDQGRLAICKGLVLGALADDDEMVRKVAGSIITTCIEGGQIERWPEVIPKLLELIQRPGTMVGAFGALEKICEDSCLELDEKDPNFTTTIFPALFPHMSSPSPVIRSQVLKCVNHFLMAQSNAFYPHFETYMNILYNCTSDTSPLVKKYVCQAFNSIVECRPEVLVNIMENVVLFMLHVMQEADKEAGLEAADFFLIFAEEDSLHIHMQPFLNQIVPVLLKCMVYSNEEVEALKAASASLQSHVADRQQDITPRFHKGKVHELAGEKHDRSAAANGANQNGSDDEGDSDEDEYSQLADHWNIRKCSAAALDLLSNVFGDDLLLELLPQLTQMLANPANGSSNPWTTQEAGILALGAVAQGCRRGMTPHLPQLVPHLLAMLSSPEPLVRSISCWTLGRYCSWIGEVPSNIQHDPQQVSFHRQTYFLPFLEQILKTCTDTNKEVQKSAMSTLSMMFEEGDPDLLVPFLDRITQTIATCFSLYQKKNMLTLLDALSSLAECMGSELGKAEYVKSFMPPLIAKWGSIADDDYDMFPMLECLASVSISLEHGFLPYAEPVWNRSMGLIKHTIVQTQQYTADPSNCVVPDKDFIVVSLDLISGIIQALGEQCEPLIGNASQGISLFGCLKYTMQDPSGDVRSSSFALLGDLCGSLFHTILPHLNETMQLIVANLEWRGDGTAVGAMNNSAWAVGEIAMKHQAQMEPFVPVLIGRLVPLLVEVRTRSLRENAAIAVGRLGFVCPQLLAPQFNHYIQKWCDVLSTVHDNHEKASAFQGMCKVIVLNPNALVPSFEAYCNAVVKWNITNLPEMKQMFLQVFQMYRNAMGDKWQPTIATFTPLIQNSMRQVYGL